MYLTNEQFEVLVFIERQQNEDITIKKIAYECHLANKSAKKIVEELQELQFIEQKGKCVYVVSPKGYEWLEPYKVKKAIFMAAGFGSRMVPVTLNTPKPLIKVHGKRIIESLIDALLEVDITDITIVRGYLGEQFDLLLRKYPMLKFVDNPIYNEANSISSLYVVRNMLEKAYLLESDLLLIDKSVIRKYEYVSNCLGMKVDYTDDWCFETKKGYITKFHVGGEKVYHQYGISYWNEADAKQLAEDIEKVFKSPGGKERCYDEVPFRECIKNYNVWVRPTHNGRITEIDTYNELKVIDPIYDV